MNAREISCLNVFVAFLIRGGYNRVEATLYAREIMELLADTKSVLDKERTRLERQIEKVKVCND